MTKKRKRKERNGKEKKEKGYLCEEIKLIHCVLKVYKTSTIKKVLAWGLLYYQIQKYKISQ